MFTGNWFKENYPDLVVDAYKEGNVLVIDIPYGRIKIMPEHRKPRRNKKNLQIRNGSTIVQIDVSKY